MAMQKDMMSRAVRDSFAKLDPRVQVQNPVMFLVWLSAAMTSILAIASIFGVQDAGVPTYYVIAIAVILWLTGYTPGGLARQLAQRTDMASFFGQAPRFNPAGAEIKGVVCGVRVEDIEDPLMQKIRYLDKLIDELAKGRPMEKILRGTKDGGEQC